MTALALGAHAQMNLLAPACKVEASLAPDAKQLREFEARRQAQREEALREEKRVAGERARKTAPPRGPPAGPGDAQPVGGIGLGPGVTHRAPLTRTVTIESGGKNYTAEVAATFPPERAAELLRRHAQEEERIGPEKQPLLLAVDAGSPERVSAALARGADPRNVVDRRGVRIGIVAHAVTVWLREPPQQQNADADRFLAVVRALTDAGADPSQPENPGGATTALDIVLAGNQLRAPDPARLHAFAELLLDRGASLRPAQSLARVAERNDALAVAVLRHGDAGQPGLDASLKEAAAMGNRDLVVLFLREGADPRAAPRVVDMAILRRDDGLWELIRDRGIDANAPLMNQATALVSVMHDHEWMEDVIRLGANVNARSGGPIQSIAPTALHAAMTTDTYVAGQYGSRMLDPATRAKSVELLLKHGADPNARAEDGRTPLMYAWPDDGPAIRLLLDAGARVIVPKEAGPIGPVSWSVAQANDTLASEIVRRRKLPDVSDCGEVYYAARTGAAVTLRLLLETGAPRMRWQDPSGETPLIAAAAAGQMATVRLLLEHRVGSVDEGTDPPIQFGYHESHPTRGVTALMAAARAGSPEIVQLLLDHGADVRKRDERRNTAREYASSDGVRELLDEAARRRR